MRIAIFGAGGYIGSALVPYLCERGHQVTAIDTFPNPAAIRGACAYPNLTIAKGDCREVGFIAKHAAKADVIYWLIGMTGDKPLEAMREINVELPRRLAQALLGSDQLVVYANTNAGYERDGLYHSATVTEDMPMVGKTNYSKTKIEAESILLTKLKNCVSFRLAAVYGPAPIIRWETLLNNFIWHAAFGYMFELFQPKAVRDVIFISDLIHFMSIALDSRLHGVYNLTGVSATKEAFALAVNAAVGFDFRVNEGIDPEGRDYSVSMERFNCATGGYKCTDLSAGISATVGALRLDLV